jgi:hypothetical protein
MNKFEIFVNICEVFFQLIHPNFCDEKYENDENIENIENDDEYNFGLSFF